MSRGFLVLFFKLTAESTLGTHYLLIYINTRTFTLCLLYAKQSVVLHGLRLALEKQKLKLMPVARGLGALAPSSPPRPLPPPQLLTLAFP